MRIKLCRNALNPSNCCFDLGSHVDISPVYSEQFQASVHRGGLILTFALPIYSVLLYESLPNLFLIFLEDTKYGSVI